MSAGMLSGWPIELRSATRHYRGADGPVRAVDGVDLEVAREECVAIMGPSGSGKSAFLATSGLRRSIEQAAPGGLTVIDNLSASLQRARTDSSLAKILFIALGLPGTLLAGYLSFYGGGLLAEAERRERALLRARGFAPAALARSLAFQVVAIAAFGSAIGAAVAIAVARALFPSQFDPHGTGFVTSLATSSSLHGACGSARRSSPPGACLP